MEVWKKLGKALLFPSLAIMIPLIPIATALLVYAMVFVGTESVLAYISYVLAAYTLTVWCVKIPKIIAFFKSFKQKNPYAVRWSEDVRLRVNVSLYGSLIWNTAYAVFQLWLGFYHASFWFYSMAAYYLFLALMRFFLVQHMGKNKGMQDLRGELHRYRICGWVFLFMNLALAMMVFFMVYWNRTFHHHEITTIALAAYTFTAFTTAIVNLIRYRKYQSPVFSASKAISLAAASVSMLTLTSTMLTTFGNNTTDLAFNRLMLALIGSAVSLFIITMAVFMILQSTKKLKQILADQSNEEKINESTRK